jgi:hypothetical protein
LKDDLWFLYSKIAAIPGASITISNREGGVLVEARVIDDSGEFKVLHQKDYNMNSHQVEISWVPGVKTREILEWMSDLTQEKNVTL